MSLGWYVNRLRSMSAAEIAHRAVEKRRKLRSRGRHEGWARFEDGLAASPVLPGLREAVLHAPPPVRDAIARISGDVLAGRFAALGQEWPQRAADELFPADLWRLDPVSGGLWPGAEHYCFDIAYRHERSLGDIKYAWEANRLQFLQPLAAQVLLADDETALAAIEACLASWHAANPPFRGIAWNSGIELALRTISLLVVTSLCEPRLSPATVAKVRAMLAAHAFWLSRFPSRFSSANNHLIAEAAGEFLISLAMPDLASAAAMGARSRGILEGEIEKQIFADGVPGEQSPTYGAFSVEFVLLAAQAARWADQPFNEKLADRLSAFGDHVAAIADGDGRTPSIGDDDEGRVIWLGAETHYPASIVNAASAHLGSPAPLEAPYPHLRGAIFGEAATIGALPVMKGPTTFPDGGYSVLDHEVGGRGLRLVLDHGPLGYLAIAAHGHADALSVTLDIDGLPVLVDPGTYLYHSGGAWRDWFRGTRAHNTLTVEGQDQSIMSGAFNWSHKAKAWLNAADATSVTASHDGYRKRFGVVHQRRVEMTASGFVLTDELGGGGVREIELVYQLAPGLRAEIDGSHARIFEEDRHILTIVFPAAGVRAACGEDDADGGWVSPVFGVKVAATRLSWRGKAGSAPLVTELKLSGRQA